MRWTAVVPLKEGLERKARLGSRLGGKDRIRLTDDMARHVLHCLDAVDAISRQILLAPVPLELGAVEWVRDEGRGLNAELAALHSALQPEALLVIHADLPLLTPADVATLLCAAERSGGAIAPDRHGTGTNAVALVRSAPFPFAFGPDSFARHTGAMSGAIVRREGLSHDLDTPADYEVVHARGTVSALCREAGEGGASSRAAASGRM